MINLCMMTVLSELVFLLMMFPDIVSFEVTFVVHTFHISTRTARVFEERKKTIFLKCYQVKCGKIVGGDTAGFRVDKTVSIAQWQTIM